MSVDARSIVAYMLSRLGCTHPFRLSRLLALAEIRSLEERGERLTGLRYVPGPGVFYVEGFKEMMEGDPCFVFHKGDPQTGRKGCVEYTCEPPEVPESVKRVVDSVLEEYSRLPDMELNRLVVEHRLFRRLAQG